MVSFDPMIEHLMVLPLIEYGDGCYIINRCSVSFRIDSVVGGDFLDCREELLIVVENFC